MVSRKTVCLRRLGGNQGVRCRPGGSSPARRLAPAKAGVTAAKLVAGWSDRTGAACVGRSVLAIQDRCEVKFPTTAQRRRGLGPVGTTTVGSSRAAPSRSAAGSSRRAGRSAATSRRSPRWAGSGAGRGGGARLGARPVVQRRRHRGRVLHRAGDGGFRHGVLRTPVRRGDRRYHHAFLRTLVRRRAARPTAPAARLRDDDRGPCADDCRYPRRAVRGPGLRARRRSSGVGRLPRGRPRHGQTVARPAWRTPPSCAARTRTGTSSPGSSGCLWAAAALSAGSVPASRSSRWRRSCRVGGGDTGFGAVLLSRAGYAKRSPALFRRDDGRVPLGHAAATPTAARMGRRPCLRRTALFFAAPWRPRRLSTQTWRTLTSARQRHGETALTVHVNYGAGEFRLGAAPGGYALPDGATVRQGPLHAGA